MVPAPDRPLLPSVLDRLIDDSPEETTERPLSGTEHLRILRNSIRRDLEALLNARLPVVETPEDLKELHESSFEFGVPDVTGTNLSSQGRRARFLRDLEGLIRKYEPRFKSVKVSPISADDPTDRLLHFKIDALVHAEPAPEALTFSSHMEPVTRSFQVKA